MQLIERAVKAIEKSFSCRLCMHDYSDKFTKISIPKIHLNPWCTKLKSQQNNLTQLCIDFDRQQVQNQLKFNQKPFFKQCHCGFYEAVVPIFWHELLVGVIFAGPFEFVASTQLRLIASDFLLDKQIKTPPSLSSSESEKLLIFLELLSRQLAINSEQNLSGTDRKGHIVSFIAQHFAQPIGLDDIAEFINLTPPRASEQIKKIFGIPFCELLNIERIERAKTLLTNTVFSIAEIAENCGYNDVAYFYRVFRRYARTTPKLYRQNFIQQDA